MNEGGGDEVVEKNDKSGIDSMMVIVVKESDRPYGVWSGGNKPPCKQIVTKPGRQ